MTDYECPACGGGFPASDADGECPWCGEAMADSERQSLNVDPVPRPQPIPDPDPPATDGDFDLDPHFQPVTPHWDSGIRIDTTTTNSTAQSTASVARGVADTGSSAATPRVNAGRPPIHNRGDDA